MENEGIITLFRSSDILEIMSIAAILEENNIQYNIQNANIQALFGMGCLGTGFNLAVGLINIQIHKEEFAQAKQLMEVTEADEQDLPADFPSGNSCQQSAPYWARSVILTLFGIMGIGALIGIGFAKKGYKERPGFSLMGIILGIISLFPIIRIFISILLFSIPLGIFILFLYFLAISSFQSYEKKPQKMVLFLFLFSCLGVLLIQTSPILYYRYQPFSDILNTLLNYSL